MSKDTPNFRGHFPLTTRRRKSRKSLQKWRMPRGIDRSIASVRGPMPKIGYGHKKEDKYNHPSGLKEIFVRSKKDLEEINSDKVAIRFSSTLGKKKKQELLDIAKAKNYKVLN